MIVSILFVIFVGLGGGLTVGAGFVAFLTVMGIVPRLMQLTKTMRFVQAYEGAVISGAVFYPSFIRRNRRDKLKRKLQNKSERLSAETAICLELCQSFSDRRFDLSDRAGSSRFLHPLF